MRYIAKQAGLVAASLIAALSLAVVPVGAEHGTGGSGSSGDSTTTSAEPNETTSDGHHDQTTVVKTETDTSTTEHSGKLRDDARLLLQTKRESIKEHTEVERQKACTLRQNSIDKRTAAYGAAAQRHLNEFNKIFTKVQAFQAKRQLTVSNYDALVAAATAKQTAAQTAVDALKALNVQIDCTQSDPAGTVATIKTAVSNARTALQDYRTAIKNLIVALHTAADAAKASSTGGDQ